MGVALPPVRMSRGALLGALVWAVVVALCGAVAAVTDDDGPSVSADVAEGIDTDAVEEGIEDYVDAIVDAASDGEAADGIIEADDSGFRCIVGKMIEAVGLPAFETAGVTPDDLGDADNLLDAGFALDQATIDQLVVDAHTCGVADDMARGGLAAVAEETGSSGGLLAPDDHVACLTAAIDGHPTLLPLFVQSFVGSTDGAAVDAAIDDALSNGFAGCPALMADVLVHVFEASGLDVPEAGRACLERELTARADQVASAFLGQDQAASQEFGAVIGEACASELFG